jgi:hypothetical protein
MQVEAAGEDVSPGIEFWNQHGIPEFDILIVGFDNPHGVHNQDFHFLSIACLAAISGAIASRMGFPPPTSWQWHEPRRDTLRTGVT